MSPQFTGKAWRERLGKLSCALISGSTTPPRTLVLMCHGFGAPGEDLVTLAPEIMALEPATADGVLFAFPEAPLTLTELGMPGARAWWMLDMDRLMRIQRGDSSGVKRMRTEIPPGLESAHAALKETLEALQSATGIPLSRTVLGGFSQGAMITTDLAFRLPESPAGLAILSGTLICEEAWTKSAPARKGLRVVQSHGRQDPILPYDYAEDLKRLLTASGLSVDFVPFDGGHTIVGEALEKFAALVASVAR